MTVVTFDMSRNSSAIAAPGESSTIWGLDARALHDRFWLTHGVQIVRRQSDAPLNGRADLYLLLNPDELVLFNPPDEVRRLSRRRPACLRIRLREPEADPYSERVETDGSNNLTAIRRSYYPSIKSEARLYLTRNPRLASIWRASPDRGTGLRNLIAASGFKGSRSADRRGLLYDASDPHQARRCIRALMARWDDVDSACQHVAQCQPGVWSHESSRIDKDARIIGPVWIGAGTVVAAKDIIIGPWTLPDRIPIDGVLPADFVVPQRKPVPLPQTAHPAMPTPRHRPGKRIFDIVFSLAALLFSAPLFPLLMLGIWIEDGRPFFFAHTRQTRGGKYFTCYKFRTMCHNAERLKADLMASNVCDGPQFHILRDPRLLRVGRLMRKFHLDELPQFLNVLLGQMHVIGPRPSPDNENQFCPAWRETRLSVKPGMTGLWQVSRTRAPNADFQEWIRYDLDYVRRENWRLDMWIVYRTIRGVLAPIHLPQIHRVEKAEQELTDTVVVDNAELIEQPQPSDATATMSPEPASSSAELNMRVHPASGQSTRAAA